MKFQRPGYENPQAAGTCSEILEPVKPRFRFTDINIAIKENAAAGHLA